MTAGMPDENSLSDAATFAGQSKRQRPDVSLGDERTRGGGGVAAGLDTVIDDIEVVDLDARYKVEGTLGQGGMGAVLLATDTRLDRKVAIKRILGEVAGNRMAVQRFLTEAKAIAALNHPNIVQIYDYGRAKDGPFLIMEYVDGGSLLDRCRESALPLDEAIELACQLCDGLAKAHDLGIVHRDIKPANVLLTKDGIPKLTDFGLAKAHNGDHGQTVTGAILGTPDFMPPEQRRDASLVDHRSDLWSLAATIYQMVTGRSPKVIRVHELPQGLQAVMARALEDAKESRFQTALDLRDALRRSGGGLLVGPVTVPEGNHDLQQEGRCNACGTINADINRKFCRKCGGPLRVPCFNCDAQTPVWEIICGECGANQPQRLADLQALLERKRVRAQSLLAAGSYEEAIAAAQEITAETHPWLADIAAWAVAFARVTAQESARQSEFASQQLAEAQRHIANRDDAAAIAALEAIPEHTRDVQACTLLANCTSRLTETHTLVERLKERVAADELDGLLPSVARLLELGGGTDDVVVLQRRLMKRRDARLRDAQNFLAQEDLARACEAVANGCVEDFDEDGRRLVWQLLSCSAFAAPLSTALVAERQNDFRVAATALDAIPEPSRGIIVPGRTESVAEFLDRMQGHVHRHLQRQERLARHALCREQLASVRAAKEAGKRAAVTACTNAGIAAEATRCVFETTAGPITVVIQRSWSPSWALWFATIVKAGAFGAAAVRAQHAALPLPLLDQGGFVVCDPKELDTTLRVTPASEPTSARSADKTPLGKMRQWQIEHGMIVAIECPSNPLGSPSVVLNASGGGCEAAIGWIDQDASVAALTALWETRKPKGLVGVVATVRLASPPECLDLKPPLQQGLDLAAQSRWGESVAALEAAVAEDPQDVNAWIGIGVGLKHLERFEESVAAMEQARAANPKISAFLYNLACYHALAGHAEQAVERLAEAVAMRPEWQASAKIDSDFSSVRRDKRFIAVVSNREPARKLQADLKKGLTLADRGCVEEAVELLLCLTERHPHLVDAWVAIGRCFKRQHRPSDAAEAMRHGLEASRGHPRLLYNRACYQSLAGHTTEALRSLMHSISRYPQYAEVAETDDDFDSIRSDPRFGVIVSHADRLSQLSL